MADTNIKIPIIGDSSQDLTSGETLVEKRGDYLDKEDINNNEKIKFPRIMTVQEVASYLRISRFSVYNLVKRGELPAMRVLNKLRFDPKSIEQYLSKQRINVE